MSSNTTVSPVAVRRICCEPAGTLTNAELPALSTFESVAVPSGAPDVVTNASKAAGKPDALNTRRPACPVVGVNVLVSVTNAVLAPLGYAMTVSCAPACSGGVQPARAVVVPFTRTDRFGVAAFTDEHAELVPNARLLPPVSAAVPRPQSR